MKLITIISLAWIVLLFTVQDAVIYASFKLNQTSITALFCINKNKSSSSCHGKCFLTKKISEQKQQEQNSQAPSCQKSLQIFYLPSIFEKLSIKLSYTHISTNFDYKLESGILWKTKFL